MPPPVLIHHGSVGEMCLNKNSRSRLLKSRLLFAQRLEKWGFGPGLPLKGVSAVDVEGLQSITSPMSLHLLRELEAATFKGAYDGGP